MHPTAPGFIAGPSFGGPLPPNPPGGVAVAFWNLRDNSEGLNAGYEALLLERSTTYAGTPRGEARMDQVQARTPNAARVMFPHVQWLDRAGLHGRAWSSSYVVHGVADPKAFNAGLGRLFDAHAQDGRVGGLRHVGAVVGAQAVSWSAGPRGLTERVGFLALSNLFRCTVWSPEYSVAATQSSWRGRPENLSSTGGSTSSRTAFVVRFMPAFVAIVSPGSFAPGQHFYPRALNAQIHPLARAFLSLGNARAAARYCHLNPGTRLETLTELLDEQPKHLHWAGADLMHVTDMDGRRRMVVIETNSSPSGQKSMPLYAEEQEQGGYRTLVERCVVPRMRGRRLPVGRLAVLYDKNLMEASGYAAAMADVFDEDVLLVPCFQGAEDPLTRWDKGVLQVRSDAGWEPVRVAHRYVTQKPWDRIPVRTRTLLTNGVIGCLAGGRNKAIAAKAYALQNARLAGDGLAVETPYTVREVRREEIPMQLRELGGHGVIKVPYSNAGQGVWTITGQQELDAFMALEHHYERFIVQSLIGHHAWSSQTVHGRLFHVGTMPSARKHEIFAADLRVMVCSTGAGFQPVALYARRARAPLRAEVDSNDSWSVLGTNLSVKVDGAWSTEPERLLMMDRRDFSQLGLGLDDLIEAYVQTVLAVSAIDRMAQELMGPKGLRRRLFASLVADPVLMQEIPRWAH